MSRVNGVRATPMPPIGRKGGEFALANITTKPRRLPNRVVLLAKGGWGKTSFAGQIPGAVFLMVGDETGLLTLMASGQLPDTLPHFPQPVAIKNDLLMASATLAVEQHGHKALVVDGIKQVDRIIGEKVCQEDYSGNWADFNDWGGDKSSKKVCQEWDEVLASFDRLREAGIGVFLIAHAKVFNFKNATGPDYERWEADMDRRSWRRVYDWADMVLFGDFETLVRKKDKKKDDAEARGKASGGEDRVLLTEWRATHDAKNRHGLPYEIDCGESAASAWAAFSSALKNKATAEK